MAETVNVTPNTTITLPSSDIGFQTIAAALLKSSENQAIGTASLAAALAPQREAKMPATEKKKSDNYLNLALLALIAVALWK